MPNTKILQKPLDDLIADMGEIGNRMSNIEQAKLAAHRILLDQLNDSLNSLEQSMNLNAISSDKLSKKIFWLNVVITAATVTGSIIAYFSLIK
jgi:hypothetical protein